MSSMVRIGSAVGLFVFFAAANATQVSAAGFQLREQSSEGIGNAFAGSAAKATTPATIWYNPAGMTLLDGNQIAGSVTWIAPKATFSGTGTTALGNSTGSRNGGDAIMDAAVGATFAMWSFSKDLKFGLAVTSPFGLRSDYPADWTGRYFANHSAVTNININPNVAYRVNSNLSIGGGIQFDWINAKLSSQMNQNALCVASLACPYRGTILAGNPTLLPDGQLGFQGSDIGVGYNVGALWEFSPSTRVGIAYRSQIQNTLKGDAWASGSLSQAYMTSIAPNRKVRADFTVPATATASVFHQIDDRWAVMADIQWTGWSSFKALTVVGESTGKVLTETIENWRDTWFFSLGANYKFAPGHTLHVGTAYDQSAIEKASLRSVRVPDSDRYWLSTGYTWDVSKDVQWNVGYAHIFSPKSDTKLIDPKLGTITGSYSGSVDMVSTSFVYKF
ncbi:transporter [Siculibacillus lacustris]|uniref:Transporter n=2 Tax=Siculibacillus lacustris TaxID=1549641 RepID=A0A4Q9VJV5_9HYPH|nr:transporter [Siculibacillus lacustris]